MQGERNSTIKTITRKSLAKLCKKRAQNLMGHLFAITTEIVQNQPPPQFNELLLKYQSVFIEPKKRTSS